MTRRRDRRHGPDRRLGRAGGTPRGLEDVRGWDPDPAHLATAAERGAVDAAPTSPAALDGADLAVVAAPVTPLPAQVRAGARGERRVGCTVTDVGSTKGGVCAAAAGVGRFVGGHPICGSEARGPECATPSSSRAPPGS